MKIYNYVEIYNSIFIHTILMIQKEKGDLIDRSKMSYKCKKDGMI